MVNTSTRGPNAGKNTAKSKEALAGKIVLNTKEYFSSDVQQESRITDKQKITEKVPLSARERFRQLYARRSAEWL